jgi:hypothetical protein
MNAKTLCLALLLLSACARSEDASVVAETNLLQSVEPVRTPEEDDDDIALGEWRETLQDENEALEFGPAGTSPLFSLRCDARRSLFLQRHGASSTGDLPMMLVSIGSETRRIAVTSAGGAAPMLRAALAPSDPLVETIASAGTPITVRVGDSVPLTMPSSPDIAAFLARCASGERADQEGNQVEANVSAVSNEAAPAPPPAAR